MADATLPASTRALAFNIDHPDQWPVRWRVIVWTRIFRDTPNEGAARRLNRRLRACGYPSRLERVQIGPLPAGAPGLEPTLRSPLSTRALNAALEAAR